MPANDLSAKVEVVFHYTEDDYVEAQHLFRKSVRLNRWFDRGAYILVALCIGFGTISLLSGNIGSAIPVLGPALFLIVFLALFPRMFERWARRDFKKHPYLSGEMRYLFSEESVEMIGPSGTSSSQWGVFSRWIEGPTLLMLFAGERLFYIVPKRAISDSQLEELRVMLKRKVPSTTA